MSPTHRFDTHVHTTFSPDGRSAFAEYARRVDEGFADGIGFTEHYEFWPGSDACGFLDEARYKSEVQGWRDRGYKFWAGAEVDWMPQYESVINTKLAEHRFVYAIGSVHNLPTASVSSRDTSSFRDDTRFDQVIAEYRDAVTSSLAVAGFDVVGHPGVFLRHFDALFLEGKPWRGRLREMEDDLAQKIARSGKLLEVNTSGFFTARKAPCAGPFFLERYRVHGGTRVTLGSDSHEAAHLRRGFPEAGALLASLGFHEVWLPWDQSAPVPLTEYVT